MTDISGVIILMKRYSLDKLLKYGWLCLYELETQDDLSLESMLSLLNQAADYIAAIQTRKRLNSGQKDRLTNLISWYQRYDIAQLKRDILKNSRA